MGKDVVRGVGSHFSFAVSNFNIGLIPKWLELRGAALAMLVPLAP